jgi:peptide/nickel transport system permease protein
LGAFIVRRLILAVIVIWIVTVFAFLIIHMIPGDPVRTMLGMEATEEQIQMLHQDLHLDQPLIVQYGLWLNNAFHGDFGQSIMFKENVTTLLAKRLPVTLILSFSAMLVGIFFGILGGIISAIRRGGWRDQIITLLANTGIGIPIFWLGILGIYFFGLELGWLPIQGYASPWDNFVLSVRQSIMPVLCLAVGFLAVMTRQTRSSVLEVIGQDYIRTAWAKGLKERAVIFRHAFKNALIPIITIIGMQLRILVGGAVLVETVFNIPGMGRLMVRAVFDKDYVIVQACILIVAVVTVLSNLLVDIAYGWVDPRVRYH